MNKEQQNKRNKLMLSKPLVYDKVLKFDEKLARGESIGIIQLQYKYMCNFKCEHCSIEGFKEHPQKLTLDVVKDVYEQADQLGLARTTISGGEPLLFPDLEQLVEAINPNKFYINCDSNGWLLTKEKAQFLKKIGIDRVQLSLDSLDAKEHDSFRHATGSHERVIKAVDYVLDAGLDIFMQTVVDNKRLHSDEFIEYVEFFNRKGVSVFVSFAKPVGSYSGHLGCLIDKSDLEYMNALEKKFNVFTHLTPAYGQDFGCPAGKNIFSITAQGDVLICPYFHCSMGNILEEPLKDILDRLSKCKPFQAQTCLLAEDIDFINKYLIGKIYNKPVPVWYRDVFEEGDLC